jgi:hypothetical protein
MIYEYRIFNFSEAKGTDLISVLNKYGDDGWEVILRLTDHSFLMKKAKTLSERYQQDVR